MPAKSHRAVQVIGALKLAKGLLLLGFATGVFAMIGRDVQKTLGHLIHLVHGDPGNRYFQHFLTKMVGLSPKLPILAIGFFVYGALFITEGLGLLWQKRWAEYLTAIVTGSFLPLEGYELYHHSSAVKALLIALNVAILIYLIIRLRQDRPTAAKPARKKARPAQA